MTSPGALLPCKLKDFTRASALFADGEHVLVAISGGADSTALLLALHKLAGGMRVRLSAAHLHHRIRGPEADGDAAFVRSLACRLGIPLIEGRADVPALARRGKISLEMAARDARRRFFLRAARKAGATAVATAHTADDQAETVLLRLARGTGLRGLAGIPPQTALGTLRIVHPMLTISREEVLAFLRGQNAAWREDSSNLSAIHQRNRVRHKILPVLERELNPEARAAILRTAMLLRDDDAWLDSMARVLYASARMPGQLPGLDTRALFKAPAAACRRVIHLWLTEAAIPAERIDFHLVERVRDLLSGSRSEAQIEMPGGHAAQLRQCRLVLRAPQTAGKPRRIRKRCVRIPGKTVLQEAGLEIRTHLMRGIVKERDRKAGDLPASASLAPAPLRGRALHVRSWQPGDRIQPFGMRGSRKLQDIWTDAKIPREERSMIPVFECSGEIVWIPGYRVARGWEVQDAREPALQIEITRTGTKDRTAE